MKLSIAIPTRERAEYLRHSLQSTLIAARNARAEIEIVVSDNASTDDTQAMVAGLNAPEIRYCRLNNRLSMRSNFENALCNCSGDYILFIGDDDGFLPSGLAALETVLAQNDADIVNWALINYIWPDPAQGVPGHLELRGTKMLGDLRQVDPARIRAAFQSGIDANYKRGGNLYHGCVSRRVIEQVIARTGAPYFRANAPDVYASLVNALVADRPILHVARPISLGGASPRSNGAGQQQAKDGKTTEATQEYQRFIRESEHDPYLADLSNANTSVRMMTLAIYELACANMGVPFEPNLGNWEKRVRRDLASYSADRLEPCRADFQRLFGKPLDMPGAPPTTVTNAPQNRDDKFRRSGGAGKLRVEGGRAMQTITSAGAFLDQVFGDLPGPARGIAAARQALRIWQRLGQVGDLPA